jgi:acetylornithine deacetylase/succinyl-diaminopimelate desuccinylase-like protein
MPLRKLLMTAIFAAPLISVSCQENAIKTAEPIAAEANASKDAATRIQRTPRATVAALKRHETVQAAFADIESHRQENIETLIELTEIPAPPFKEDKRGQHLSKLFKAAGIDDVKIDEVGNVIARRAGTKGTRTVAIVAHIDTVFPIETEVKVRKDGDTYYAPGIGDNTQGVVLMLSLVKAMQAQNIETEADILFIGNVGEEGLGDLRGVKHLYREGAEPIDSMIAIDGGGNGGLVYGAVGSYRYRVTFKGRGGHSWGDFGAANPHHALARAIENFAQLAPEVTSEGERSSFSVGRIGGGTSVNSIPFESWMEVDMRSGEVAKIDAIDAIFKKAMQDGLDEENAARKHGPELSVEIKSVGLRPAGKGDPNSPLVQHAIAAMESFDLQPRLGISSTDANIPISLGKPAITIGRGGISRGAHGLDESWEDKDSHVAIQIALLTLLAEAGFVEP